MHRPIYLFTIGDVLEIVPDGLPSGRQEQAYSAGIELRGFIGLPSLSISAGGANLAAAGITFTDHGNGTATFSSDELLSGGVYTVTVRGRDGVRNRAVLKSFAILVVASLPDAPPLQIIGDLPSGAEGVAYSERLQVTGGRGDCTLAIVDGALPPGGSLDWDSGTREIIVEWPDTVDADTYTFTIEAEDEDARISQRGFAVSVLEAAPSAKWFLLAGTSIYVTDNPRDWADASSLNIGFVANQSYSNGVECFVQQIGVIGSLRSTVDDWDSIAAVASWWEVHGNRLVWAGGYWIESRGTSGMWTGTGPNPYDGSWVQRTELRGAGLAWLPDVVYAHWGNQRNRSNDNGLSWVGTTDPGISISHLCSNRVDLIVGAAVVSGAPQVRETEDTISWVNPSLPSPRSTVTSISGLCYTGLGFLLVCDNGDVYYKLDSGGGWQLSSEVFGAAGSHSVASDGVVTLFCGNDRAMRLSYDGGVSWTDPDSFPPVGSSVQLQAPMPIMVTPEKPT